MTDQTSNPNNTKPYPLKISRLINSFYFAYQVALIVEVKKDSLYRLILHNNGSNVYDNVYPTLRGAKISFAKYCPPFETNLQIQSEWSDLYAPENEWMEQFKLPPISERKILEVNQKFAEIKAKRKRKNTPLPGVPQ